MSQPHQDGEVLGAAEYQRYARQMILPEVGIEGQRCLKRARVLVVGSGGLGSPALLYLAAAGVGFIDVVDFDTVEVSNLHRQVLFSIDDVGKAKVEVVKERLRAVNPHTVITPIATRLDAGNAQAIMARCDLVIDCTDNFETRYLINDACLLAGKTYVYAAIFQFEGYLSVFAAADGPCYRCVHSERPPSDLIPSCAEGGVLGVLPGVLGTLQGIEAIKLLLGIGEPIIGRMLQYDALSAAFRQFEVARDPHCPACASGRKPELIDDSVVCAAPPSDSQIAPALLAEWIKTRRSFVLLDVRTAAESSIARISGDLAIPLAELETRRGEIPRGVPVVCYCLSGARSMKAVEFLARHGFAPVLSLAGGILHWNARSEEVGP